MKLAISNIAWAPRDSGAVYRMMAEHGFRGLEIAPGLAFPDEDDAFLPGDATVKRFFDDLADFDIRPVSMQSLLFGTSGALLFGDADERRRFEDAVTRAIVLAGRLGIANLVFGSPANRRYPNDIDEDAALDQGKAMFHRLGDIAKAHGAVIAIEPNPAEYGTNFLTTTAQTATFVVALDHPNIGLNLDLGAVAMNGEGEVDGLVALANDRVAHVHISEPQLQPAPRDIGRVAEAARSLLARKYDGWFSIEMRPPGDGLTVIEGCLARAAAALAMAEGAGHA